ncbi:DUF4870 domain-containing protein [Jeotgalicoccus halotolerans]|uniref:DUF4870 domain-containing protein n=1 Tax=Jeotgalicoccus nanhaiensis TaxID=568603 RepID=A0ABR9XVA9_9STAP|nr:DUF4870 domain-containing protein [Jeotgalicoccus nanhaiensis]MBF0752950.1 DUF4870 domain-containing protein [Jeotgalicoccus nanhaiensis]TFU63106.1 DUF4870 domain-containing protein [Jeotgalicoccus nanhaiensis]
MNDFDNSPRTGFDSTLVLVSYIVSLFTAVVGPLIIWVLKKDDDPLTSDALRHVANFGLSYTIYMFAAWLTSIILIGLVLGPIVTIAFYVFAIIGIVKAVNGEVYKPPFTIDIFK